MKPTIEYSIGKYQIRLNIWLFILFLLAQSGLNELGFWQLNRAKEKQIRLQQLELGKQTSIDNLDSLNATHLQRFQHVNLQLEALNEKTIYLDNQTHNKAPGYHVLNLAKDLKTGKYLLVNRGWIFGGSDRRELPRVKNPGISWQVKGRLYPINMAPTTSLSGEVEALYEGYRLPSMDQEMLGVLKEKFNVSIENYLLRLDDGEPMALTTNWMWTNMPVDKHLAYAVQWFGLALALLIISLFVAIKKKVN